MNGELGVTLVLSAPVAASGHGAKTHGDRLVIRASSFLLPWRFRPSALAEGSGLTRPASSLILPPERALGEWFAELAAESQDGEGGAVNGER